MRRLKILAAILAGCLLFLQTPQWHYAKSLIIMGAYSAYEAQTGLLEKAGLDLYMPGGSATPARDWYPFVMTFNGGPGLAAYVGKDIDATILYNFGAWHPAEATTHYLDPESPYYNSFYGAYVVRDKAGGSFGFDAAGEPVAEDIAKIPAYDMKVLVFSSIGCPAPVFTTVPTNSWRQAMLGYDGWFVFDADIRTNGAYHRYDGPHRAYIQYGFPKEPEKLAAPPEDFAPMDMQGRIYGKYFEEAGVSVFFYIIAGSQALIEETETQFILASRLEFAADGE